MFQVIKEDLKMLKVVPDRWTHSSDHFEIMLEKCEQLLREGEWVRDEIWLLGGFSSSKPITGLAWLRGAKS